jgi:hypothetical protein
MTQSQVHTVAEFWVAHIRQKLGLEPSKVLSSQLVKELKCVEAYSISPTHKVNKRTEYETVRCVNNIPFGDQSYDQPLYIIAEIPPKAGFCQWELRQLQRYNKFFVNLYFISCKQICVKFNHRNGNN